MALTGSILLGLVVAAGCGQSNSVEVVGRVTWNGQPLADGDIAFMPEPGTQGRQSSAPITAGEYRLTAEWGLMPGSYQVQINGYRAPATPATKLEGGFLDVPPETPGVPAREQFLPAKFNAQTTLDKLVIAPGQKRVEQNYDLKE